MARIISVHSFRGRHRRLRPARAYGRPVAAAIPHADELMALASTGLFALRYPDHPIAATLRDLADSLIDDQPRS